MDLSPNGKALVSVGKDAAIRVWSMETGELLQHLEPHGGKVHSVDWWDGGSMVVAGGRDKVVRVWKFQ